MIAIAALLGLATVGGRALKRHGSETSASPATENAFGRRYRLLVAAQAGLLTTGLVILWALDAPQQAYLAWTALIVGLHFIAFRLVGIWGRSIDRPATVLVLLGLAGLGLAATPAAAWVPLISGVLVGLTLLTVGVSVAARESRVDARTVGVRRDEAIRSVIKQYPDVKVTPDRLPRGFPRGADPDVEQREVVIECVGTCVIVSSAPRRDHRP